MKLSVITVAYKNSKVVIDLLNSIAKYNDIGDELEVIIVDNSPEEKRIDKAIQVADYKDYIYIKADNRGFGAGNNIGAKIAKGEILAFLNPDIILIEPIFKKVINAFQQDSKLVWLGGELLTIDGRHNLSYGLRLEYWHGIKNFILDKVQRMQNVYSANKMYLTGADIFIQKDIFKQVGGFDENIFMYCEESDLMLRIEAYDNRSKIRYCPNIRMIHLEGQSTDTNNFVVQELYRARMYYYKKFKFDFRKIFRDEISVDKLKNFIDRWIRPYKVEQRKAKLRFLQENYPEIFE